MCQTYSICDEPYLMIKIEINETTTNIMKSTSWSFAFVLRLSFDIYYGSFASSRVSLSVLLARQHFLWCMMSLT